MLLWSYHQLYTRRGGTLGGELVAANGGEESTSGGVGKDTKVKTGKLFVWTHLEIM